MSARNVVRQVFAACAIMMACAAGGAEIRNVTAKQRYPWNGKVDISYTIVGDVAAEAAQSGEVAVLKVAAIDKTANTTNIASALSGDVGIAEGKHSLVWDMKADGLLFKSSNVVFRVYCGTATYCVIDLSAGSSATSYPVTYLAETPSGGFNVSEYKTSKLVLKWIGAGSFMMGDSYHVTLTKPFYCGLFEVTQRQWELVTGSNPCSSTSDGGGNSYPVFVSYDMIRGSSVGAGWPSSSAVDASSFLGKLRARTGVNFDLPTEAQWEYACRAGTTTTYSYGNSDNGSYMWYRSNQDSHSNEIGHEVGTKSPNPWGFYDMHGNVWEWCLDWYSSSLSSGIADPGGPSSGESETRVLRGGDWLSSAVRCTSSYRDDAPSSWESGWTGVYGFRLVGTPPDQ